MQQFILEAGVLMKLKREEEKKSPKKQSFFREIPKELWETTYKQAARDYDGHEIKKSNLEPEEGLLIAALEKSNIQAVM